MVTELVPIVLPAPGGPPRSEGVHVSRVIRSIAAANGILKPEYCEDLSLVEVGDQNSQWWESLGEVNQLRIAMGLSWEEWYARNVLYPLLGVVFHPGEMCCEGIYMTPDGESLDMIYSTLMAIHEIKLTYKSTKTVGNLESQWMWLAQVKCYVKALVEKYGAFIFRNRPVYVAYIHVLFACGDYTFPIRPMLRCWRLEFTQEEIDDNWELHTDWIRHQQQQEREEQMKDTEDPQ